MKDIESKKQEFFEEFETLLGSIKIIELVWEHVEQVLLEQQEEIFLDGREYGLLLMQELVGLLPKKLERKRKKLEQKYLNTKD